MRSEPLKDKCSKGKKRVPTVAKEGPSKGKKVQSRESQRWLPGVQAGAKIPGGMGCDTPQR